MNLYSLFWAVSWLKLRWSSFGLIIPPKRLCTDSNRNYPFTHFHFMSLFTKLITWKTVRAHYLHVGSYMCLQPPLVPSPIEVPVDTPLASVPGIMLPGTDYGHPKTSGFDEPHVDICMDDDSVICLPGIVPPIPFDLEILLLYRMGSAESVAMLLNVSIFGGQNVITADLLHYWFSPDGEVPSLETLKTAHSNHVHVDVPTSLLLGEWLRTSRCRSTH